MILLRYLTYLGRIILNNLPDLLFFLCATPRLNDLKVRSSSNPDSYTHYIIIEVDDVLYKKIKSIAGNKPIEKVLSYMVSALVDEFYDEFKNVKKTDIK